ncbi:MAG: GerMN domain-containing protein [Nitrospinota bacterium]|nr:GerMN domain-containing protein [Nitrospinota bacterium]
MSNDKGKDPPVDSDGSETIELGQEDMAPALGKWNIDKPPAPDAPIDPSVDSWNLESNPETEPTANYEPVPRLIPVDEIEEVGEGSHLIKNLAEHPQERGDLDYDSRPPVMETHGDQPLEEEPDEDSSSGDTRYLILMGVLILIGAIVWLVPNPGWQSSPLENTNAEMLGSGQTTAQTLETTSIKLYVPDPSLSFLITASHPVNLPPLLEKRIQIVLTELFAEKRAVNAIYPQGMLVRSVYVSKTAAIISLNGSFRKNYHTGAWTELLAVYSIVNTVVGAFDQVKKVVLLIDDMEEEMFVSHVDISGSLYFDKSLVKIVKNPKGKSKNNSGPLTGGKNG